ncbi:MAG: cytochrome c3 family protein [Deltaproteobacteria bacterium]|jgi:hypothetical protein|nr:cytochrome c3 family protein [Deltaproteobacteria bacterium]
MRKGIPLAIAFFVWVCVASIFPAGAETGEADSPGPTLTGGMPETVTLGSLADRYEPVDFDHSGHVDMASGCGDCHHQHGTDQLLGCRECHSLDSSAFRRSVKVEMFRACRECHAGPSPKPDPARTGLAAAYHRACFRCHREVGSVGEDPKGCTEMCHARKETAKTARDERPKTVPR